VDRWRRREIGISGGRSLRRPRPTQGCSAEKKKPHSSSPAKQIKMLQYNHEPIQLRLPTSGWLMAYTYGSSLPLRESQNVCGGSLHKSVWQQTPSLYQAVLGFTTRQYNIQGHVRVTHTCKLCGKAVVAHNLYIFLYCVWK
jgi:hypothetical protein